MRLRLPINLSLLLCLSNVVKEVDCACRDGYTTLCSDRCVRQSSEMKTKVDAKADCTADGGYLATVHGMLDNHCLFAHSQGKTLNGLSCEQVGGTRFYSWPDSSPVNYSTVEDGACGPNVGYYFQPVSLPAAVDTKWYMERDVYALYICQLNASESGSCPSGYSTTCSETRCIRPSTVRANYADASEACAKEGATLFSIHSEQENNCIADLIMESVMLGLHCDGNGIESNYKWQDGSDYDYNNLNTISCGEAVNFFFKKSMMMWKSSTVDSDQLYYYCETPQVEGTPSPTSDTAPSSSSPLAQDGPMTADNVTFLLNSALDLSVSKGDRLDEGDVVYVAGIISEAASLRGINESDAVLVLANVDALLNANSSVLQQSNVAESVLESLPILVRTANLPILSFLAGRNFGFIARSNNSLESFTVYGLVQTSNSFMEYKGNKSSHFENSVWIPRYAIEKSGAAHVMFAIFRTRKLFITSRPHRTFFASWTFNRMQLDETNNNTNTDDTEEPIDECIKQISMLDDVPVFTASLLPPNDTMGKIATIDGTRFIAGIRADLSEHQNPLHGSFKLAWWEKPTSEWSVSQPCSSSVEDGILTAHCTHLTDFTVIVDGTLKDLLLCRSDLLALGYVTNILSILSLTILIFHAPFNCVASCLHRVIGFTIERASGGVNMFFMYMVTLFLFYIVFTIFSVEFVSGDACSFFAICSYILLMTAIVILIVIACMTGYDFVFPSGHLLRDSLTRKQLFIFYALVLGFVTLFSIVLAETTDFFLRRDGFCWVRSDYVFFGVIMPVSTLLACSIVCTGLAMWKAISGLPALTYGARSNEVMNALWQRVRFVILMMLQLGIPWVCQYFTIFWNCTFWHYAFTLFNGSHGIVLLLIRLFEKRRSHLRKLAKEKNSEDIQMGEHGHLFRQRMLSIEQSTNTQETPIDIPRGIFTIEESIRGREDNTRDQDVRRLPLFQRPMHTMFTKIRLLAQMIILR